MAIKNKDGSVYNSGIADLNKAALQPADLSSVEVPPVVVDKPSEQTPEQFQNSKIKNILYMHCLPVKEDDTWGETVTLDTVLLDRAGFSIEFWTPYPVVKGSIVFPFKYNDGTEFLDFRWWKIVTVEPYKNGHHATCIFSDLQPAFK